jgi:lipoprotein-anchoring transpeptidase ErfK/SrfK
MTLTQKPSVNARRTLLRASILLIIACVGMVADVHGYAAFAQDTAGTELVFDAARDKWVRRPATNSSAKARYSRSDASPIAPEVVDFTASYPVGTIIIDTGQRRLFRLIGDDKAMRYAIGVGREGFAWKGRERISRKAEWPSWTPPEEMRQREAAQGRILPARMDGGPDNPLGARALYLGSTLYRIHGTNQPWTIGQAVSSGCIRMANDDVIQLYEATKPGDLVIVR